MDEAQELFFSYTGKPQDRRSIGVHTMEAEKVRHSAISLYVDLRQRQRKAGIEVVADVWINAKKLNPTKEELEAYQQHVEAILQREREWREVHADGLDACEDESSEHEEREESHEEVDLTEDDFAAAAAAARIDDAADEVEELPLVDLVGLDMGFDSDSDLEI